MREIVSLAQGKCGISIQEQIWLTLLQEQGFDLNGIQTKQDFQNNIDTYFKEVKQNVYKPRSVLMDLDPSRLNQLECGPLSKFFIGTPMIFSNYASDNNFAKGYYTEGAILKSQIEDSFRQEVERCDVLDSIQLQRSICGGSGSGLGNIVLNIAREYYVSEIVNSLINFPDLNGISQNQLEIYNTILSLHQIIELSDLVIPFTNDSVQSISDNSINLKSYKNYEQINAIVGQIQPGMTCNVRYPGSINASTRKICTNLIPFPRIKFMSITYLPLNYYKANQFYDIEYSDMISECLNPQYFIQNKCPPKVYCSQHIFRGVDIHEEEIEKSLYNLYESKGSLKTEWIANSSSISYCNQPSLTNSKQLLSIINNRNIYDTFKMYAEKFTQMFRRKVFLHVFTQEGMDEMEFVEAESNVFDIVSENTPCCYGDEYEEEEEGEYEDEEGFFSQDD